MQVDYSSLLFMIVLIVLGFVLRKIKLLQTVHIDSLPTILLNVAYPALIVKSVTSINTKNLAQESIIVILVTIIITLSLFFCGSLALKNYKNKERKPLILFSIAIGNIVFVALPVIYAVFGDVGVYYTILHNSAQDIIVWTLYYAYFVGSGKFKGITFKKLMSPSFIALVVAITLVVLGISPQGAISDFLKTLADLTVPLALIYIGGILAGHNRVKDWLPGRDTIIISVVKVFTLPFLVFGFMKFLPVDYELKLLMAVLFSAPATILSTIWAKKYGYDYVFSIKTLIFSTMLFLAMSALLFVFVNAGII